MVSKTMVKRFNHVALIIASALIFWKGVTALQNAESPIAVVMSGSMDPGYTRGDLIFLSTHLEKTIEMGDVLVFRIENMDMPVVHRVHRIYDNNHQNVVKYEEFGEFSEPFVLTKGDHNFVDDRLLYPDGQIFLCPKHFVGKIDGYCPYLGWITLVLHDYAFARYAFLTGLGLFYLKEFVG